MRSITDSLPQRADGWGKGKGLTGTILCVDDQRDFCQILATALGGEGYAVRTAFDGDQAIDALAEEPPDLLLLDLILPRRDGFAVLEAFREMGSCVRDIPAVIISGCSPTPEYRQRAAALGVMEMLTKPLPLEELLAVVARYVGEPKQQIPVSATRLSEAANSREAGVCGSLEQSAFPALLHHLHGLRATGVLHLSSARKRKWIEFREGYPRSIRSNLVNECLGNFLVRGEKISQAAMAESLRRAEFGKHQSEILVAMEVMSEDDIAQSLSAQADEKLYEIFSWTSGNYRFEKYAQLPRSDSLGLKKSPANLILRGVCERFPIERIEEFLRSHADRFLIHADSSFYQFQKVALQPDHTKLLGALGEPQQIVEFLQSDSDLKRALYGLLAIGLLELRGAAAQQLPRRPRRNATEREPIPEEDGEKRPQLMALAGRVRNQSYFEILGVDSSAGLDQIRTAYEQLAARMHPDRYIRSSEAISRLAEEVFDSITRAYDTLVDPRRRTEYLLNQRREKREAAQVEESERALEAERCFQRGQALLSKHAYEPALHAFGRTLELCPGEGEYHAHYGWALHLCHPAEPAIAGEAIEHVRRGIKLAGDREKPYLFLGRLYKVIGRVRAAEKLFIRAAQIKPDCVEALRELRLINMRRHRSKSLIGRLFGR